MIVVLLLGNDISLPAVLRQPAALRQFAALLGLLGQGDPPERVEALAAVLGLLAPRDLPGLSGLPGLLASRDPPGRRDPPGLQALRAPRASPGRLVVSDLPVPQDRQAHLARVVREQEELSSQWSQRQPSLLGSYPVCIVHRLGQNFCGSRSKEVVVAVVPD